MSFQSLRSQDRAAKDCYDFLFGEGGFSNIANLIPGVNLDSGGS